MLYTTPMTSALESIASEVLALVSGGCQCQQQPPPVPQQQDMPPAQAAQAGQSTDPPSPSFSGEYQAPQVTNLVFFGSGQASTPMQPIRQA
jgi:hypothetical protein